MAADHDDTRRERWTLIARWVHRLRAAQYEECCQRCARPSRVWAAPSPLWNYVMRGDDIAGNPLYGDLVCMSCFADLAEQVLPGLKWRLDATNVPVPLKTTTPSGRTWDADAWLWVEPTPVTARPLAEPS